MLSECQSVHGGSLLVAEDPPVREALDVSFYPGSRGDTELFHSNGRAVAEAVVYMGLTAPNVPQGALQRPPEPLEQAPNEFAYVYAGFLHEHHYGHFLLSGLPRFWYLPAVISDNTRFVYSGGLTPDEVFKVPYVGQIFSALGLRPGHFMRFQQGARFERILVPAPSFEENNLGHPAFARLCNRIGSILTTNLPAASNRRPLYLSKHKVRHGVSRVVNEEEVVRDLARLGADVVCPERLPLSEQVRLWRDRTVIYGIIGSAFHTSIFVPKPRCIILNHVSEVWSNQVILDRVNGTKVDYCYPTAGVTNAGRDRDFANNFILNDPTHLAHALLKRAQAACEET